MHAFVGELQCVAILFHGVKADALVPTHCAAAVSKAVSVPLTSQAQQGTNDYSVSVRERIETEYQKREWHWNIHILPRMPLTVRVEGQRIIQLYIMMV